MYINALKFIKYIKQYINPGLNIFYTIVISYIIIISSTYGYDYQLKQAKKCINNIKKYEVAYNLPQNALFAISLKETGRNYSGKIKKFNLTNVIPWPWAVNSNGKGYYFANKIDAIKFVKAQIKSGNFNIDVGCAQINLKAHPFAFKSIEQSFDPSKNINYAAYLLRKNYNTYKNWFKSIAVYHSKTEELGIKYANSVLQILDKIYKHNF